MKLLHVASLLPLLLFASELEAAKRRANRCYAVRIDAVERSSSEGSRKRRFRRRFSAQQVLDLRFNVWLHAKNDARTVEIKLYTPTGRLYEVLHASVDADTPRSRRRRRVVSARMAVAGSHVTSRSIYGRWRAEVFLDGNDRPCTRRPKKFFIDP